MTSREKEPKFWTCNEHAERLTATTVEDAVQEWADDLWPEKPPGIVTAYGFAPMDLGDPGFETDRILEYLLESLDEEHGDPEGEGTIPTDSMKAAVEAFVEAVYGEYEVWACEKVCERIVKVPVLAITELEL